MDESLVFPNLRNECLYKYLHGTLGACFTEE